MATKIDDFIKSVESTAEEDFFTPRTFYHLSSSMFDEMCELLKEQKRSGTWEWITEDKYRCSECKNETFVDECMNEPQYLFCPYCGCKMTFEGNWMKR